MMPLILFPAASYFSRHQCRASAIQLVLVDAFAPGVLLRTLHAIFIFDFGQKAEASRIDHAADMSGTRRPSSPLSARTPENYAALIWGYYIGISPFLCCLILLPVTSPPHTRQKLVSIFISLIIIDDAAST